MLTLKDIQEYDIQNIDLKGLLEKLARRQDYLINITLIVATIFLGIKIMADQKNKAAHLKQQITLLEEKIGAISEFEVAKNGLEGYVAALPQGLLETNTIIEHLNNLAAARHIQILSYEPAEHATTDAYIRTNFKLALATDRYEDIGLFIQDIENSNYNFRVEEWSAQTSDGGAEGEGIHSNLTISSLYFKK